MRQLLTAGGVVALGGLVSAGVMLMQPTADAGMGQATAKRSTQKPSAGGFVAVKQSEPPAPEGSEMGPARAQPSPAKPTRKPRDASLTRGAKSRDPGVRKGGDPKRPGGSDTVPCLVRVDNLPAANRDNYSVDAGNGQVVRLGRSGPVRLDLPKTGQRVRLVDGPRYGGQKMIYPLVDCDKGQSAALVAKPKPAQVKFTNYPDNFVVECRKGCSGKWERGRFPELPIPDGKDRLQVELTFRATGYEHRDEKKWLSPGRNPWKVNLRPKK